MPRRKKVDIGKSFKKMGKDIKKGFDKTVGKAGKEVMQGFTTAGKELGNITNNELLPAITTIGMPMASTMAGMAGQYLGGPLGGMTAEALSSNIMKEYIPKKYQSSNKYIQMVGDVLNQAGKTAITGEFDPESAMNTALNLLPAEKKKKYAFSDNSLNMRQLYTPDDPFRDLLTQSMRYYPPQPQPEPQQMAGFRDVNDEENDALYKDDMDDNYNTITIKQSPYQQKEGSSNGLLGAGIKKKKKKDTVKVEVVKKLPYQKFSHAKNSSLEQLLEAMEEKKAKKSKEDLLDMMTMQMEMLEDMGYNKPKKNRRNNYGY